MDERVPTGDLLTTDASALQIRDPFVVVAEGRHWLFGSTDRDIWRGPGTGFDCYASDDLRVWHGPVPAFRPPTGFWGVDNFWAPEVHPYDGRWYMFATFHAPGAFRASQVLASDRVEGPYAPWSEGPITPAGWECLDATLHVDAEGTPWTVFCHEWQQVHDGAIWAQRLDDDLRSPRGRPVWLFNASEAPWTRPLSGRDGLRFPAYVTDGPFLWRTGAGDLLLLWSSFTHRGYALGVARSESGEVCGPWVHDPDPLVDGDGGHGMVFRGLDGVLRLAYHAPNQTPLERLVLREVHERDGTLRLA